jgi:hypothetical protein
VAARSQHFSGVQLERGTCWAAPWARLTITRFVPHWNNNAPPLEHWEANPYVLNEGSDTVWNDFRR